MKPSLYSPASTPVVRVAPLDRTAPDAVLLLLEVPWRLPFELRVPRDAFVVLGLESLGASARRERESALTFLMGQFPGTAFDIAEIMANALWPELGAAARAIAFGRVGPRGLAALGGRLFPSAGTGLSRRDQWPRRRR